MRGRLVLVGILTVAIGATLVGSCRAPGRRTVKFAGDQVSLETPAGWSNYAWRGSTAIELTRSREMPKGEVSDAHMMVFTEKRRGHDEAVARLGEIAAESNVASTFLLIDGWPALRRSQTVTVPRPDAADGAADGPEVRVVQVTTAVAASDLVVRSEASVPVEAGSSVVTEVEAIGASLRFTARPSAPQSDGELRSLQSAKERPAVAPATPPPAMRIKADRIHTPPGVPSPAATALNGELEVAVSKDGRHVVVAAQFATPLFSDDGGLTFNTATRTLPAMLGNNGDPSIAIGASGAFYVAFLTTPGGACGSSVMSSAPNNGAAFTFVANAVLCPAAGNPKCFPDQEHIAADPNPSSTGTDQLYVVYRHFTPQWGANCPLSNYFYPFPTMTCSADSGKTWTSPTPIAAGDDARVTVGGDGFVWVVQRAGGWIVIHKFSSCETGMQPQPGFPKNVVAVSDPFCPVPGLDRCDGPSLSSAMVAVDQADPTHVYVAYANATSSANDDIVVTDTADAFTTTPSSPRSAIVNGPAVGRRFMPWVCTLGGSAQVTWYDRRAATTTSNDLTAYFRGSASLVGSALVSGAEVNVSVANDPQCTTGFPCGERDAHDADDCPTPQNDGTCQDPAGTGSGIACDQNRTMCPAGEKCVANGNNFGCPKYGDYNGTACAAGHVFAAWASATPPPGLPAPGGIGLFVDALPCGGLGEACCLRRRACRPGLACNAADVCAASAASACGAVMQPCCPGASCAAGSVCSAGACVPCPPVARTLADTTAHNGSDCFGTSRDYDFGPATCDPGFVLGMCSATLISEANGSTCAATPIVGCSCRVHVTTPKDCSKWATCRVIVTEAPIGGTPAGCP